MKMQADNTYTQNEHVMWCLLKSVGVKLKVWVTEDDGIWSGDDDVDGFVQLLRMTPARSAAMATWTSITIRGLRSQHKTRLVTTFYFSAIFIRCVLCQSESTSTVPAVIVSSYLQCTLVVNCMKRPRCHYERHILFHTFKNQLKTIYFPCTTTFKHPANACDPYVKRFSKRSATDVF